MLTSSGAVHVPSVAFSRKTYAPVALNVAVVARLFGAENTTVAGPLSMDHWTTGGGSCVAVTCPKSVRSFAGKLSVFAGPASTENWHGPVPLLLTPCFEEHAASTSPRPRPIKDSGVSLRCSTCSIIDLHSFEISGVSLDGQCNPIHAQGSAAHWRYHEKPHLQRK